MHICIVGTGVSGLLVANQLKEQEFISKITIIGSPKIPHIGVGESTTLTFQSAQKSFNVDLKEFIVESHAAIKYGVYYENWSSRDWIHFFKSSLPFKRSGLSVRKYIQLLGNKPTDTFIHDLYGKQIWKEAVDKNNVFPEDIISLENEKEYYNSFHFDAGQYIKFLKKQASKSPKIKFIDETVINVNFSEEYINSLNLSNNLKIKADYYINTTGQRSENNNIFKEQYNSLEHILLTNKAVVTPLKYTNKREQFHPYTIAKTMKHGWRWITPTWERIGTGYTFSNSHVSEDEAINEFILDIGDKTIIPRVVDFTPRINKKTFRLNSCSIGMANGFLEPLDAPGLTLSNVTTKYLEDLLRIYYKDISSTSPINLKNNSLYSEGRDILNKNVEKDFNFWVTFILNQYKTCYREDTHFWKDQKNVEWDMWNLVIKDLNKFCNIHKNDQDVMMFAQTLSSRDINYHNPLPKHLTPLDFPIKEKLSKVQHHLDYIESFHKL